MKDQGLELGRPVQLQTFVCPSGYEKTKWRDAGCASSAGGFALHTGQDQILTEIEIVAQVRSTVENAARIMAPVVISGEGEDRFNTPDEKYMIWGYLRPQAQPRTLPDHIQIAISLRYDYERFLALQADENPVISIDGMVFHKGVRVAPLLIATELNHCAKQGHAARLRETISGPSIQINSAIIGDGNGATKREFYCHTADDRKIPMARVCSKGFDHTSGGTQWVESNESTRETRITKWLGKNCKMERCPSYSVRDKSGLCVYCRKGVFDVKRTNQYDWKLRDVLKNQQVLCR